MEQIATTGERIRAALSARGMRQIDLVEATGLGRSAISQYVSDKVTPKQDKLYLLARALDVSEPWLMGLDVSMERNDAPPVNGDEELTEYLEELRTRPEMKMLFSLTKTATKEDVEKAVKIIEALLGK